MLAPILMTKLHLPAPRPALVARPRLLAWLDAGLAAGCKLTLISAPAGFGKTTLVSEWISCFRFPISDFGSSRAKKNPIQNRQSKIQNRVAWLSLDEGDNDPARFLTYLVAALQTVVPEMGASVQAALQSPQAPPIEALLTTLLNDIAVIPEPCILVLDDYHVLDSPPIDAALTFLLDHLPQSPLGGMHLVIATRENPSLPLARYRVRGQVTEIRAADLRFTFEEAAELLNRVMGLALSAEDIAALETRTEGWVAGLHLAALSLQGQSDTAGFIASFTGSHHFVLDYLVEEVLHRQTPSVQTFLLHTAILDRLCGPLCDAVWLNPEKTAAPSPPDSQSVLEYLERANLFLAPLDNERRYYRYHHLFSSVLRHRLQRSFPELLPTLHARAAAWFEAQGDAPKAFDHWLAAGEEEKAALVVEKYGYPYFEKADFQQLSDWLQRIPPALIQARPWLCIFHSWGLIFTGQYEEAALHLTLAEETLGPVSETGAPEQREPYGHIAASRALLASRSQDGAGILHYGGLALKHISPGKRALRGYIAFFLGTGRYEEDQYALAEAAWREAAHLNKDAGNILVAVNSLVALAELNRIQGKLHASLGVCQEAARLAVDEWEHPLPVSAEVYVASARLHYEWNDFASAEADFTKAAELMKLYPNFDLKVDFATWLTNLRLAQGNPTQAAGLIHEIEASDRQPFYKSAAAFLACRLTYYLAVGDLAMIDHIVRRHDWNLDDKNIFAWAEAFLAYARVLVDQKAFQRANDLLEACRTKLETCALWTPALKALILQAGISQQQGAVGMAQEQIQRALTLAEPEGFVQLFVDEGPLVGRLLFAAATCETLPEHVRHYARKLVAGCEAQVQEAHVIAQRPPAAATQPLIEPLSERELEVLRLIAQGLSNGEIAARLFVALPTVKGHNLKIYSKLQVQRRTEAVARARELGLL